MNGGKVLGSGTYGCIFRPPLLCKGQTERQQGYVSKLMVEEEAENEYQEVQKLLQYIVSIPDYQKYFIIDGITKCVPQDITSSDLEDFNKKCKALTNEKITAALVKDEIARGKVLALQIPDGGMSVYDYLQIPGLTDQDVINLNNALINLIQYGIRPMNMNGVIHADVKAENIVYSSGTKEAKLIDWGLAKVVIPPKPKSGTFPRNPKTYSPILDLSLMFNEPLTNILFYKNFPIQAKYKQFLHSYKSQINSELMNPDKSKIEETLINNIYSYFFTNVFSSSAKMRRVFNDHMIGHYSYIADVYFKGNTEQLRQTITKLITYALFKYSYNPSQNRLNEFNTGKYFQEVFKMNVDIFGTLSCLFPIARTMQRNASFVNAVQELERKYMVGRKYAMEPYNIDEITSDLRRLNTFLSPAPVGDTPNPVAPAPVGDIPNPVAPAPVGDIPNPVAPVAAPVAPAPVAAPVAPAPAPAPAPAALEKKLKNMRTIMLGGKKPKKTYKRIRVKKQRSKRQRVKKHRATKRKLKKSKTRKRK